ncbi:uncharacterized protein [Antedon mediterranea]|uniref:uncharacterized protein n=1 Tax=Antedon mediterranea TaxID=105859 RepID=UPI003AF5E9DC
MSSQLLSEGRSKTYCRECRRYLCHICNDAHKNIPACKNHKLHSVEDVRSMSVNEINAMHPPLCSVHNEPLTVFCKICNVAICIHCSIMDHKEWEGKDKHLTISIKDVFKTFKQTSAGLEREAKRCTAKLKDDLKVMTDCVKKLDENREKSLRGIENHVMELVTRIKESEDKLKSEVEAIYKIKRKTTDADIEDVTKTISYINTNINLLHHLGKGNEATAMLSATLTQPTGETIITEVKEDDNGDYTVIGICTSAWICKVDVRVNGEHIKKSPMTIMVEKKGLLNNIKIDKDVYDVVKYGDDCLLVSCLDNGVYKYKQTGKYIGKVTLSEGVSVYRMLLMNNGNIAFSDRGNKCITLCTMNGKVVKSFGKGQLTNHHGIHVDEASRVICLKLFDNEGIKVLVDEGDEDGKVMYPKRVVVDDNDNIIISSDRQKKKNICITVSLKCSFNVYTHWNT